jgi:hypothetical protein
MDLRALKDSLAGVLLDCGCVGVVSFAVDVPPIVCVLTDNCSSVDGRREPSITGDSCMDTLREGLFRVGTLVSSGGKHARHRG